MEGCAQPERRRSPTWAYRAGHRSRCADLTAALLLPEGAIDQLLRRGGEHTGPVLPRGEHEQMSRAGGGELDAVLEPAARRRRGDLIRASLRLQGNRHPAQNPCPDQFVLDGEHPLHAIAVFFAQSLVEELGAELIEDVPR